MIQESFYKENTKLYILPQGWVWTRLGEISEIIMGQSPSSNTYNADKNGFPFYQGKSEFRDISPIPVKWCSKPKKIAEKNDILLSIRAPVGPTNICYETSCIGRGLTAIRYRFDEAYKFIFYYLRSIEKELSSIGTGSTFSAISKSQIENLRLPLPPLPEQRRIVAKIEELFTELDAGVEALKKVKAQIKRYRQAVLKHAFEGKLTEEWRKSSLLSLRGSETTEAISKDGIASPSARNDNLPELPEGWVWIDLNDIAEFKNGINFDKNQKGSQGILTLDVLNMYSKGIFVDTNELYRVNKSVKDDYLLKYGDILFVRSSVKREGVGWTSVFKEISEPVTFCGFIIRARLQNQKTLPEYITYFLRTDFARELIVSKGSQVTITNISQSALSKIPIPLAPLHEQRQIVSEIERHFSVADEVEKVVDQSLKQAERLRQSILKRAFEGRLVLQDPSDEPAERLLERIGEWKAKQELSKKDKMGMRQKYKCNRR